MFCFVLIGTINTFGCLEHDVARNSQGLLQNFSIPLATSCSRYPNVFIGSNFVKIIDKALCYK